MVHVPLWCLKCVYANIVWKYYTLCVGFKKAHMLAKSSLQRNCNILLLTVPASCKIARNLLREVCCPQIWRDRKWHDMGFYPEPPIWKMRISQVGSSLQGSGWKKLEPPPIIEWSLVFLVFPYHVVAPNDPCSVSVRWRLLHFMSATSPPPSRFLLLFLGLLVASSTATICVGLVCKVFNNSTLHCQAHAPYFPCVHPRNHIFWHSFWHIFLTFLWHSFWHIFWKYLLSDLFFLTVFLTFFLTYLLKIPSFWPFFSHSLSDILSDISSEITFFLTFFLTVFLTSFLTYLLKLPSFWPFFSHSLSDIFSEISFFLTCFSHSLSDTSCDKASDMSFWHIFWHYFFHLFWCSVCYSWCHSFWHSFGHLNVVTIAYMKRPEYILHTPLKRGSCLHQWRKAQLQANILNANMFFLIYMVIAHMYICFGVCLKIFLRYLQKLNISGEICRDSTELIFLVPLKHHFFGHDTIGICFFGHPKLVISRNIEHHLNTLKLQVLWTTCLLY